MEEEEKSVLGCPLFRNIPPERVAEALEEAGVRRREFQRGDVIYAPHAFERSLGILLTGRVAVRKGSLPVSLLGPGELFGAAALYNDEPDYVTTLTAKTGCAALFFSQGQMDKLLARWPEIGRNYICYLSARIRFLSGKVEELAGPTAEDRVVRYLAAHGEKGSFLPDCSWTELAGRLGMGRASLYRVLDGLEEKGRLHREGKTLIWKG